MADLTPKESGDGPLVGPDRASPPSTPRWVKLFGVIAAVVVVAIVVFALAGGGEHGPGRHMPGGDNGGHEPPVQHSP